MRLMSHHGGWRKTPVALLPPTADHSGLTILPEVDPRNEMPPIFDQGQLGSCTANATAACFEYDTIVDGKDCGPLSRLWIYYQERKIEGELGQGDTGAIGVDAFKAASTVGVCKEADWPYDIETFQGPVPAAATRDEGYYRLRKPYRSVTPTVDAMKAVLSNRQTIAFGFSVYDSFESDDCLDSGVVPMPNPKKEQLLGGHEVLLCGYLNSKPAGVVLPHGKTIADYGLVRNSWGVGVGLSGYFLFPWTLLTSRTLASDWQTIVRPAGR